MKEIFSKRRKTKICSDFERKEDSVKPTEDYSNSRDQDRPGQTRTEEKIIEDYRRIQKLKKKIIEDYRRIQKLNNNQSNSEERRR